MRQILIAMSVVLGVVLLRIGFVISSIRPRRRHQRERPPATCRPSTCRRICAFSCFTAPKPRQSWASPPLFATRNQRRVHYTRPAARRGYAIHQPLRRGDRAQAADADADRNRQGGRASCGIAQTGLTRSSSRVHFSPDEHVHSEARRSRHALLWNLRGRERQAPAGRPPIEAR